MAKKGSKAESNMKVVPLGDRVVLKREDATSTTAGGIVLPDTAKDKPQKGTVVSVGDGHVSRDGKRHALTLKAGDKVIFSSYAGDEISIGDEEYMLLRESDVLAVYSASRNRKRRCESEIRNQKSEMQISRRRVFKWRR